MSEIFKANLQFYVNAGIAAFGVLIAARQPANNWDWVQLIAGLGVAVLGVARGTLADSFKMAQTMDQKIEAKALRMIETGQILNPNDGGR